MRTVKNSVQKKNYTVFEKGNTVVHADGATIVVVGYYDNYCKHNGRTLCQGCGSDGDVIRGLPFGGGRETNYCIKSDEKELWSLSGVMGNV